MINTIKRNWSEIQRCMILSQKTKYNWLEYSAKISNGLSNNALTKIGCGDIIWFVERLNEYALLPDNYLLFAKKMTQEQVDFINDNREFLITIK